MLIINWVPLCKSEIVKTVRTKWMCKGSPLKRDSMSNKNSSIAENMSLEAHGKDTHLVSEICLVAFSSKWIFFFCSCLLVFLLMHLAFHLPYNPIPSSLDWISNCLVIWLSWANSHQMIWKQPYSASSDTLASWSLPTCNCLGSLLIIQIICDAFRDWSKFC